jgi:oligopeptidase A
MNPLLDPLNLPDFAALSPEAIGPALDEAIAEHRAVVADLTSRRPIDFESAWLPYERANLMLEALWNAVGHLHGVADTPELREAYVAGRKKLVENDMEVRQNGALYEMLVGIEASPEFATLALENRVAVEHAIRDFRLAGVALEQEQRERFREILVELSSLSTAFSSAVLDATDAWFEHVTDVGTLAGISEADMAMFASAAEARSLDGWVVTLQQPSVSAVMAYAKDRALRARVYEANTTKASDQGPNAGKFDNGPRIARILELRHEAAALLGFPNPVEWSLATKMAPNAGEVLTFLRDIASRARPNAVAERDEMAAFANERLGLEKLEPWDVGFASNLLREERYSIDEQEVRRYFPVERVLAGWKSLLERLFGISLRQRDGMNLYHADAQFYDVVDAAGEPIAGVYLDLFARPGKRSGAWMAEARPRLMDGNSVALPVAYLVCNFAPNEEAAPSLLYHSEITTLLHETGHVLHHLFTRVNRPSVAGTAGFEWDAVELPSQLLEDFAWDRDVLTGMSGHEETGEQLPAELYGRMLAAKNFQSGLFLVRQVEFSLFDILLHLGTLGSDPMEVIEAVRDEVAVIRPPAWNRFPYAFNHIFSGSYASGYYSYLWAEVLAADGFDRFVEAGLVDRATGDLLREEILSRGATRPARESFRAFRGRDADPAAMLRRHGLVETVE